MSNQSISPSRHRFSSIIPIDSTLVVSSVIAITLHALLIFGISFSSGKAPKDMMKDVAISMSLNTKVDENANFIANATQEGSGEIKEKKRLESSQVSPMSQDTIDDTEDVINQERKIRQQRYQQSYLNATLSYRKEDEENENKDKKHDNNLEEQTERVRKEIATLEAQLSQQAQVLSTKTQIKTLDSNSTSADGAALYLNKFRQHVEGIANQYYPSKAIANNITGNVRLMVIIKPDGNLKAIRLLESSGSVILDEAAKSSVRQAAPFGSFTGDMKDIIELRIIRTWSYSDSITVFKE